VVLALTQLPYYYQNENGFVRHIPLEPQQTNIPKNPHLLFSFPQSHWDCFSLAKARDRNDGQFSKSTIILPQNANLSKGDSLY